MATDPVARVARPAARILLVDAAGRVLMLRFTPADRPPLWCTPGGAVDPGESYAAAARRELWEEVGLDLDCGPEVARRTVDFTTFEGVEVTADERYFRVDVAGHDVRAGALTALEQQVLHSWRWFAPGELAVLGEAFFPVDLADMVQATAPPPNPSRRVSSLRQEDPMTDQAPTQGDDPVPDTQADPAADPSVRPGDGDGNTADRPPEVTGGQPKVGDDLPRNTEF